MTTSLRAVISAEICAKLKALGYARSNRIRLYGEEYEVVSDPFGKDDGVAVEVTTGKERAPRSPKLAKHDLRVGSHRRKEQQLIGVYFTSRRAPGRSEGTWDDIPEQSQLHGS